MNKYHVRDVDARLYRQLHVGGGLAMNKYHVRDVDARLSACVASARRCTSTRIKEPKPLCPAFANILIGGYFLCELGIVHIKTYPTGAMQVLTGQYYAFDAKAEVRPIKSLELTVNL